MLHVIPFRRWSALCLVAGAAFASASPALAAEVIGELSAQIDGEPYQGNALYLPSEGTATATFQKFGPSVIVSVQVLDPAADRMLDNSFQIEFSGNGQGAGSTDASASWWPEGMRGAFYVAGNEGGDAEVRIDELQLDGEARASGSFTASMCHKESFFVEADMSKCVTVEGTFDTALRPG